jgi:hypothetical protein
MAAAAAMLAPLVMVAPAAAESEKPAARTLTIFATDQAVRPGQETAAAIGVRASYLDDVRVVLDPTGISGFATIRVRTQRWDCLTRGLVVRCRPTVFPLGSIDYAITVVDKGAKPGTSGRLNVVVTRYDETVTASPTVTVGRAVTMKATDTVTAAAPGGTVAMPVEVRNAGSTTIDATVLMLEFPNSVSYTGEFGNCQTWPGGMACVFGQGLRPNTTHRLSTGIPALIAQRARSGSTIRSTATWFTTAEWAVAPTHEPSVRGTGPDLELVGAPPARSPSVPELNVGGPSRAYVDVRVTGGQPADVPATGDEGRADGVTRSDGTASRLVAAVTAAALLVAGALLLLIWRRRRRGA